MELGINAASHHHFTSAVHHFETAERAALRTVPANPAAAAVAAASRPDGLVALGPGAAIIARQHLRCARCAAAVDQAAADAADKHGDSHPAAAGAGKADECGTEELHECRRRWADLGSRYLLMMPVRRPGRLLLALSGKG
jgi:hypothetical protein